MKPLEAVFHLPTAQQPLTMSNRRCRSPPLRRLQLLGRASIELRMVLPIWKKKPVRVKQANPAIPMYQGKSTNPCCFPCFCCLLVTGNALLLSFYCSLASNNALCSYSTRSCLCQLLYRCLGLLHARVKSSLLREQVVATGWQWELVLKFQFGEFPSIDLRHSPMQLRLFTLTSVIWHFS